MIDIIAHRFGDAEDLFLRSIITLVFALTTAFLVNDGERRTHAMAV